MNKSGQRLHLHYKKIPNGITGAYLSYKNLMHDTYTYILFSNTNYIATFI